PYKNDEWFKEQRVDRLATLENLIANADFISLHVPKTAETTGMISAAALKHCRPGSYLINTARGGVVNETALLEALNNNMLLGAALDVFEKEPPEDFTLTSLALIAHPRVIATPHTGGSTREARKAIAIETAENIIRYLTLDKINNAVNTPHVPEEEFNELQPYLQLGKRLMKLLASITPFRPSAATIAVSGISQPQAAVVQNLLTRTLMEELLATKIPNGEEDRTKLAYVNAPIIAEAYGINVSLRIETTAQSGNHIKITLENADKRDVGKMEITGMLHDGRDGIEPRVSSIDGCPLESQFGEWMLFYRNRNVPGIIGKVGTALGEYGVNIDSMTNNSSAVGEAINILRLSFSKETNAAAALQLERELASIPAISYAKLVQMS
ncbi:MAG: hypothetical protein A3J67_01480, partial [Parcubacteria group bacterium RIFCSPHIGHO2_02_FULL_48_10b]